MLMHWHQRIRELPGRSTAEWWVLLPPPSLAIRTLIGILASSFYYKAHLPRLKSLKVQLDPTSVFSSPIRISP